MNGQAADIVALRVPLVGDAQIDVIHPRRVYPCALDGGVDDMAGHDRRFGIVEGAAIGFADAGAGGRDDGCFAHGINP